MQGQTEHEDDVAVILRVLAGEVNAFEYLLEKYKGYVFSILQKHLPCDQVEDVAQDVFIRAYRSLPTLKNRSGFKNWLSSITVKTAYDFWRRQYRNREMAMSDLSIENRNWLENILADASNRSFQAAHSRKDAREVLDWAFNRLSAEERMVIQMVYLEGFSGKEAARLLGWSTANVKVRSFRARKKLRKLLESQVDLQR
ncbi:MAG: RNA polymerase sigma factor [Deltaproteobacteria bacterium]|nr:RNA polymerase sigma factor [Deltaproteobacteria bacterium]